MMGLKPLALVVAVVVVAGSMSMAEVARAEDSDPSTPTYEKYNAKTLEWIRSVKATNRWVSKTDKYLTGMRLFVSNTSRYVGWLNDVTFDACYEDEANTVGYRAAKFGIANGRAYRAWTRGAPNASLRHFRQGTTWLKRAMNAYVNTYSDC